MARQPFRLGIFPFWAESDFLDAWQKHRIEVVSHLHENRLTAATVFAIQVNYGMACRTGSSEVIEYLIAPFYPANTKAINYKIDALRIIEVLCAKHVFEDFSTTLTCGVTWVFPPCS